jgi:hypothetical protein
MLLDNAFSFDDREFDQRVRKLKSDEPVEYTVEPLRRLAIELPTGTDSSIRLRREAMATRERM